jgi:hypothetical protein
MMYVYLYFFPIGIMRIHYALEKYSKMKVHHRSNNISDITQMETTCIAVVPSIVLDLNTNHHLSLDAMACDDHLARALRML